VRSDRFIKLELPWFSVFVPCFFFCRVMDLQTAITRASAKGEWKGKAKAKGNAKGTDEGSSGEGSAPVEIDTSAAGRAAWIRSFLYVRVQVFRRDDLPSEPLDVADADATMGLVIKGGVSWLPCLLSLGIKKRVLRLLYDVDKQTLGVWTPVFLRGEDGEPTADFEVASEGDFRWVIKPVEWWSTEGMYRLVPLSDEERVVMYVDASCSSGLKGQEAIAFLESLQNAESPSLGGRTAPRSVRGPREKPSIVRQDARDVRGAQIPLSFCVACGRVGRVSRCSRCQGGGIAARTVSWLIGADISSPALRRLTRLV
jgi:hypothetical protein